MSIGCAIGNCVLLSHPSEGTEAMPTHSSLLNGASSSSNAATSPPAQVQSLSRGLAVIRAFTADQPRQTISTIAAATSLAKSTARRFLHTLVELKYANTDGSHFWLTPQVLELGFSYLSGQELPAIAQPRLEVLSRTVNESCSLSIIDGADIVYLARVPVRRIMTSSVTVGSRLPAWATSSGRVILASLSDEEISSHLRSADLRQMTERTICGRTALHEELARVATQGWSVVDQELAPGLCSVAAPIHSTEGGVAGAVNISIPAASYSVEGLQKDLLPPLLETARMITNDLAARRMPGS